MSTPGFHVIKCDKVGTAAAGATEIARVGVNPLPMKLLLQKAVLVLDTAVTASDSNYATLLVKIGSTTIATITTETSGTGGTGDIAAGASYDIAAFITATGADLEIDVGESFSVTKSAYTGTGAVISGHLSISAIELRS